MAKQNNVVAAVAKQTGTSLRLTIGDDAETGFLDWSRTRASDRAAMLERAADELERDMPLWLPLLAREAGRVLSRDDILNQLRGHEAELQTRAVDIVVSRLRRKLEPLDAIKTLRNAGYSLALGRAQPAAETRTP